MSFSPHKFREIIFQLLYARSLGSDGEKIVSFVMEHLEVTRKWVQEAHIVVEEILQSVSWIDQRIQDHVDDYSLDRLGSVEKNILRLAVHELQKSMTPYKVVIAEAIRLVRKFSTPESGKLINAVLDAIVQERIIEAHGESSVISVS